MHNTHTIKVTQSGDAAELVMPRLDRAEHFDVEVEVSWNAASRSAGCGLILGVSGNARYVLVVPANGRAAVSLIKLDGRKALTHQTFAAPESTARALREFHDTLTVKVRGEKLGFFVNARRVTEIVDKMMLDAWSLSVFAQGHQNVTFATPVIRTQ